MPKGLALVGTADERRSDDYTPRIQAEILEMRTAGMSFDHIANALGFSKRYVYKLYEKALDQIIAPGVEALRKQEAERLDIMLVPCMADIMEARNMAVAGVKMKIPEAAINLALKIAERRARLFGLDSPVKILPTGSGTSPMDILGLLNLNNMESEELGKLRDLLAKATVAEPDPVYATQPGS